MAESSNPQVKYLKKHGQGFRLVDQDRNPTGVRAGTEANGLLSRYLNSNATPIERAELVDHPNTGGECCWKLTFESSS